MLTTSFPRYLGDAAGVFVSDLSRYISRRGCDVIVLTPHDYGSKLSETQGELLIKRFRYFYPERFQKLCYGSGILKNLRTEPISLIQVPLFIISQFISVNKTIKRKKIDIIHAHWSFPQGLIGLACKYIHNIPYIVTIHGSDIYGLNFPILSKLNRLILRHAAACTVNSEETARATKRLSRLKNVQIVPMGVDTGLFNKKNTKRFSSNDRIGEKTILFVGRLIDLKGVNYLLKAMPKVLSMFPATKLLIVGKGPERIRLEKIAADLGIEKSVLFIGEIPHNELVGYYAKADVFVLPSCMNYAGETEGLGVVLLEAMACGVPVVGSNTGGIPHVIKDGITGVLSNQKDSMSIANKITDLLGNSKLREKVKSNAKDLINKEYSWDIISSKFLSIYKDVLSI